jgi:predicted metal-dependent peptidase
LSRRQHLSPDLPKLAMVGIIPHVAVIIDTSGSMSDKLLGQAIAEVDGILLALPTDANVTGYAVDAAVHVAQRLTSASQMNLLGGGGTDMGTGIQRVVDDGNANPGNKASVIVVITDGYTPWPDKPPPDCRVAVLILTKNGTSPIWACPPEHKTIRIQPVA